MVLHELRLKYYYQGVHALESVQWISNEAHSNNELYRVNVWKWLRELHVYSININYVKTFQGYEN